MRLNFSGGIFDLPSKEERLAEIKKQLEAPDLWDNAKKAQEILKEQKQIDTIIKNYTVLKEEYTTIEEFLELLDGSPDKNLEEEVIALVSKLEDKVSQLKINLLLSGKVDKNNAIVSISPGAGGTEAHDWADILFRMYLRWAERHNFKVDMLNYLTGDEAGIKNVTFLVKGEYSYGYMKGEAGVHRLIRISPFDSNKRRHTSFAAVSVSPEIDDTIEIDVNETDLRIDTYRASGAGGQHVNKTDSAVRIVHLPTGIVVQCQNERSQHQNKETALKILKSQLYQLELKKREQELSDIQGEKKDISWGSQIRSYILQPYQLVKDHRTNIETGNVKAVLDGDIDEFIKGYLLYKSSNNEGEKNGKQIK